jgi:hypothetical protein
MSEAVQSEFKGSPLLVLRYTSADKFPFQFGVKKARLILEHIKAIEKFVEENKEPVKAVA